MDYKWNSDLHTSPKVNENGYQTVMVKTEKGTIGKAEWDGEDYYTDDSNLLKDLSDVLYWAYIEEELNDT